MRPFSARFGVQFLLRSIRSGVAVRPLALLAQAIRVTPAASGARIPPRSSSNPNHDNCQLRPLVLCPADGFYPVLGGSATLGASRANGSMLLEARALHGPS